MWYSFDGFLSGTIIKSVIKNVMLIMLMLVKKKQSQKWYVKHMVTMDSSIYISNSIIHHLVNRNNHHVMYFPFSVYPLSDVSIVKVLNTLRKKIQCTFYSILNGSLYDLLLSHSDTCSSSSPPLSFELTLPNEMCVL